ncbi:TPA: ZmpA/ZmpB/ZmpC family metallo-endopeptidase [Streptococcus suis]
MHKFFYEQRKAFSLRKLTIGLVSLCVSSSLLLGIHSQEVAAETVHPSQIRFEYVLESELSAEERQLLQSALPAELREEATYFVVYRPSKKILPATGELVGSSMAVLGLGFLVLAISATKSKKAHVLTMLFVTACGLVLPALEVGAVQSSALATYNRTFLLKPGEVLPDGRLVIAGYEFVGYLVQNQSAQASLPLSETGEHNTLKETQTSTVESVPTSEVPISSQTDVEAFSKVSITAQPEVPVPSQPEAVPAVEVPVAPQPEVKPAVEVPVIPQPEVKPAVEVSVPSQPEAVPAVEVPVTPQPEVLPAVEVSVTPQSEAVSAVEVSVTPQPEVDPTVEVPVPSQPEVDPTVEVSVPSQPEMEPTVEVPVASQPEMEPTVEVPVASQPEMEPTVEVPVASQPEVVPAVEVSVPPQPEGTTETDVSTSPSVKSEAPNMGLTDAISGASQHAESPENSTSQKLTEEEIQCILNPSLTCWPEKEETLDPKVQAQQIEEAVETLKERMAQLQAYRTRFKSKEWTDYIDTVYEASRAILDARDVADMRIQAELIEDDLSFLLHETDANSGASHKTEGELIFELPQSTSETVAPPPPSMTVTAENPSHLDPATPSGESSTESDEEFCPIVPQLDATCGSETPQIDTTTSESPVKQEQSEGTAPTEIDLDKLPKPTMMIDKVAVDKDKRQAIVNYFLDDPAERFEGGIAYLFANDQLVSTVHLTGSHHQFQAVFENIEANVDYLVRTELTYMGAGESLVDSLADEAALELEERQLQIKNIDRVELWKYENGKARIQRELVDKPRDLSSYFAKVISSQQKEVLLPISDLTLQTENGEEFYSVRADFENLVEEETNSNSYSSGLTFRVGKQKKSTNKNYTDLGSLIAAIEARPWDSFTLGADLTASTLDVSGKDSYISNRFTGTLDGAGYAIYDLEAPLFNKTSGNISHLTLKEVDIHHPEKNMIGALAKEATGGKIENVSVEGRVIGGNHIGGLLGDAYQTTINKVKVKGYVASRSSEIGDNYLGGLVGWLGKDGKIQNAYTDVSLTTNSRRARVGGIAGQMESANAYIKQSYAQGAISAPKSSNSDLGGIVGTIAGNDNSLIDQVLSAVSVPHGRKLYQSATDARRQVGKVYIVKGKAVGQDNDDQEEVTVDQANTYLSTYGIDWVEEESAFTTNLNNRFDVDYSRHPHYKASRKLAYENMEKLLPFFTKDVIIQQANRLNLQDDLVTKRLLDVVAIDGYNGNRPVFDVYGQRALINKLLLHFDDGTISYEWLVKKQELNSGALMEYFVVDREITYTPENIVSSQRLDQLVDRLLPVFEPLNYGSQEVLDALGLTRSSNDYAAKELLFLKESFAKVKGNIRTHLKDLLVSSYAVGLSSQAVEDYTYDHIRKNRAQLLLGLAYMDRWYNIQFGETNARDWMTKKADFFGTPINSLDQLITLGGLGEGALKPNNNFALGSQLIAKSAVDGDLFAYLEAYRKRFVPELSDSDWFKSATKAKIIETYSTVAEVRAKQEDTSNKTYSNHFYDKLRSDTWPFKEMALILLTMPQQDIFILTDMANTLIGSYDNQVGTREEINRALEKTAKEWAGHADYLYRILPEGHKEKMFRQMITWDNKKINGRWYDVDSLSSMHVPSFRYFYMPLGYHYSFAPTAGAQSDLRNIFYFNYDAISRQGASTYTHELTHVAEDDTFLLGYGRRTSMDFETYARGLFETINWFDQDILGVNNIFDFSEYENHSYGRRLTNLNPERFQSTKDLEQYMKGYLDLIYTLDYLEGEAVLSLAGDATLNTARRNWFNKLTTLDENASLISRYRRSNAFSTVEELIDHGLVSRRSYDPPGHSDSELFPRNSYLMVNALNPIYGAVDNEGYSRNEYEFRKVAFELLAELGYEKGFVPYLSNQYYSQLGQIDPEGRIPDDQLIHLISEGSYTTIAEFRKDMFKRRKEKLDQLKPVTIYGKSDGEGYYYSASRQVESVQDLRQLMKEAVEYDARHQKYHSQQSQYQKTHSRVYSLKAALLNGYLRATDDFRKSIYKDNS